MIPAHEGGTKERTAHSRRSPSFPAEMFGVEKEIGSIATAKLANVCITTGDPLDLRTQVVEVFITGHQVPDVASGHGEMTGVVGLGV